MSTAFGVASAALRTWIIASRPATLTAAIVPVLVGTAIAAYDDSFSLLPLLAALAAASLIQIGTNFANDLFDFEHGVDVEGRLGPTRVTQSGLVSPRQVRLASCLAFGSAAGIGLYLVVIGGWPILIIGVSAVVAGVMYTGGPWPLGYHALGDIFVFAFFGLGAVIGSYYLQTEEVTWLVLAISIVVGCTATAMIVVNNLRDIDSDRLTGKRTLAVVLGSVCTRVQYSVLILAPYCLVIIIALVSFRWWILLPWTSIPVALYLAVVVLRGSDGQRLNSVLKSTAYLHLLFGALLAGGLLV